MPTTGFEPALVMTILKSLFLHYISVIMDIHKRNDKKQIKFIDSILLSNCHYKHSQ